MKECIKNTHGWVGGDICMNTALQSDVQTSSAVDSISSTPVTHSHEL